MDIINIIFNQINTITASLISINLSIEQNFPSNKDGIIYISGKKDLSVALKNINYTEIYDELNNNKNYNFKLIDGALIQMMYFFNKNDLMKHRLAFFPSPRLNDYQNDAEIYQNDEIYGDILSNKVIPTTIRFDYDLQATKELEHPSSHLTIGQYKNCRIPVFGPITPNIFMDFIVRNFYNSEKNRFLEKLNFKLDKNFIDSILHSEKNIMHLSLFN